MSDTEAKTMSQTVEIEVSTLTQILEKLETLERKVDSLTVQKTRMNSGSSLSSGGSSVLEMELYKRGVRVFGNTLPHKEYLKKKGAKWNPSLKSWIMTRDNARKAGKKLKKKFPDQVEIPDSIFCEPEESNSSESESE